jgi:catechol 2,3-dioxygenase-like lactoylglutathione lyase family enzyme
MSFGKFALSPDGGENLTSTIPVLPSRDLARTARLYERLGFKALLISEGEGYLILRREWVELHFWPFPQLDPAKNYVAAYLRVADADAAAMPFAALAGEPGCRFLPVETKPWGMREAAFIDPDGNLLKIGHPAEHRRWTASP